MFVRVIIYSGFEHDRPTDREHLFSLLRRSPFPELSLTCRIPSLPNGDNEERETTSTKTTSTTMPTETTASVSLDHCFDLSHKNLSHPFSLIAQALILSLKTNITYIFLIWHIGTHTLSNDTSACYISLSFTHKSHTLSNHINAPSFSLLHSQSLCTNFS